MSFDNEVLKIKKLKVFYHILSSERFAKVSKRYYQFFNQ
jgi:hypothetical protein